MKKMRNLNEYNFKIKYHGKNCFHIHHSVIFVNSLLK